MNLMKTTIQAKLETVPPECRKQFLAVLTDALKGDTKALTKYKHIPVDFRTFVESDYYLDSKGLLYPTVMDAATEICDGEYDEVIATGGIGSGKSTLALYVQIYQLYLLSCMADPQKYFDLDPASEIVIIFQAINAKLAKEGDYDRFKAMVEKSPYFQEKFPHDKEVTSQLIFPNRVYVIPVSGLETAAIGKNVIGGVLEEVNFMSTVENSKMADGQAYDQATALYNSIAARRKSRFQKLGRLPGRLCIVSSRRTPGQFTDKKEEEAKVNPRIYVYDKRMWDVKPGHYSGEKFNVFIGDGARQPRILNKSEELPEEDRHLIDAIPIEHHQEFINDITRALRDVAGKSTLAIHPYLPRRADVVANFGLRQSIFIEEAVDFQVGRPHVRRPLLARNNQYPRWCHLDLGLTSDSAGICIGHVPRFKEIKRGDSIEKLPVIEIDGFMEIVPPKGMKGEIDFATIRQILYKLRDMGLPIKWISMDSYQSADSLQILKSHGFTVGHESVDTSMVPYDLLKQALYDKRIVAPTHAKVLKELGSLERDFKRGKIDHPPRGSKDIADALAGVVKNLTMRRETWAQHDVPLMQAHSVSGLVQDNERGKGS